MMCKVRCHTARLSCGILVAFRCSQAGSLLTFLNRLSEPFLNCVFNFLLCCRQVHSLKRLPSLIKRNVPRREHLSAILRRDMIQQRTLSVGACRVGTLWACRRILENQSRPPSHLQTIPSALKEL